MAQLDLRHLYGSPRSWHLDGSEELAFVRLRHGLDKHEADPEMRAAVLLLTAPDGTVIGAWNREGARWLVEELRANPPTSSTLWIEMWPVLDNAVTGP